MSVDLERALREEARWRILFCLNAARPGPLAETVLLRALQDIELPITPNSLRRELDYLAERKLLEVHKKDEPVWLADLTRHGVDVVEYTVECEPGISRPKRWY